MLSSRCDFGCLIENLAWCLTYCNCRSFSLLLNHNKIRVCELPNYVKNPGKIFMHLHLDNFIVLLILKLTCRSVIHSNITQVLSNIIVLIADLLYMLWTFIYTYTGYSSKCLSIPFCKLILYSKNQINVVYEFFIWVFAFITVLSISLLCLCLRQQHIRSQLMYPNL